MWGPTVVAGASGDRSFGVQSGAAYVFKRNGTDWLQEAYLKASNTGIGDQFGRSVDISGDTAVVGAFYEASSATTVNGNELDDSGVIVGAAYVFKRTGTTWAQDAYLKGHSGGLEDYFGTSVAIEGNTIAVGARETAVCVSCDTTKPASRGRAGLAVWTFPKDERDRPQKERNTP